VDDRRYILLAYCASRMNRFCQLKLIRC
jgi:hypothetical protein